LGDKAGKFNNTSRSCVRVSSTIALHVSFTAGGGTAWLSRDSGWRLGFEQLVIIRHDLFRYTLQRSLYQRHHGCVCHYDNIREFERFGVA
jgi:hypothetical protein